uniref:Uncharacterized protein n=1 Tax=Meloidogyne enterolobii TaxID=390850 RepID=A0A6V7XSI5_MELEN|nr:unnamed protein product [Meloidogyne enterolobii]
MSEINAKIRSRTNSNSSDNKKKLISSRPNIPFKEPRKSMETEFRPRKKLIPEKRKTVKLEMGSVQDQNRYNAFRRNPRAMIRRLSRAASFKNASYSLDLQGILNQFEKHSTIHGICHAGLAPNMKWRRFWLGVFTVCFTILIVQTIYLVVKFFEYPKNVDLDLKFEMTEFPAVTICNLNPYKASAIFNDIGAQATLDAMQNALHESFVEDISFSKEDKQRYKREARLRQKDVENSKVATSRKNERRYLQVYAQCYCEMNRLSSVRKRGSCYAHYKVRRQIWCKVELNLKRRASFLYQPGQKLLIFYQTKCLCQLDTFARALWPCFPYNTWKEHICSDCVDQAGHCPMRFLNNSGNGYSNNFQNRSIQQYDKDNGVDVCLCHREQFGARLFWNTSSSSSKGVQKPIDKKQDKISLAQKQESQKIVLGFKNLTDEISIKSQARQNLIYSMGEKSEKERIQLSYRMDELILKCSFNQHDCDITSDFKLHNTAQYGNCYTFNWNRDSQITAHRAGANFGLRVLVYANVSEYLPTTEAIGFRITVHDKWTVPFVDAFGENAPTGMLSSYGVRMKKFFRLEHPYGHCRTGNQMPEGYIYTGYNYSVEGCHRSCLQQEILRICGCADPTLPIPSGSRQCGMEEQKARECIRTIQDQKVVVEERLDKCKCPLPCHEIGYELTYSAARWPSGTARIMECASSDELCLEQYRINAALIQVFYEEFNYQTLTESAAYSMTSLIADLGGLSGLWIGISIVSILEVVQLIWFCMEYIHKKKVARDTSRREHSSDDHSEPSGKTDSTPSIGQRTSSGGAKSLKSLKSMRSYVQSATGEIYPPNMRIRGEIVHSQSCSGTSTPYLAPNVELPCTCLFGARGQIVFMKPLCPVHGYMVRRMMHHKESSSEDEDDEDESEVEGPLLTVDEVEALQRETELEKEQQNLLDSRIQELDEKPEEDDNFENSSTSGSEKEDDVLLMHKR